MTARARGGPKAVVVGALLAAGCLRAPIGDDLDDGADDLGSTGEVDDATTGSTGADDACHSSYDPCLPIVDDLDCADVVAMGAAPVTVTGPDDYGLDSDNDGIGCEQ